MDNGVLSSQDWYRVRRGEDEIAWGKTYAEQALPQIIFSRRAEQERAFLDPDQANVLRERLRELQGNPQQGVIVRAGGGRRVAYVAQLRVVYRIVEAFPGIQISTIRGGKVVDPENVRPAQTGVSER
jgi:hypothetical protein